MKRSQLQRYGISILATAVALLLTQWLWWQLQLYLTKPVEPNELIAAIASLAQSSERL
ncbi:MULTISPECIES: hypothetical protein [Chroococcidiopsis]|uniref:hypothetical protein n=1 Tax=Chroococcidiopsis TaxID=54298 RepID=UPI0013159853|nr:MULTISPECIES: hypothetical protein [Chroococcidiopsis]URD48426.1 hypothetical protein M5J74_19025 [Chroococcidiopsis sp. CCNUC1]